MKKILSKIKNNFYIDALLIIFLSHVFYKITFIDSLQGDFSLLAQIRNGEVTSKSFFVESPTYTFIGLMLGLEDFDIYRIVVYIITVACLIMIVFNLQFLEKYSTLFLFSGWLVTSSWFVGYVDVISVLIITIISKNLFQSNFLFLKISFYLFLLSINHNAISLVICIVFLILVKYETKKKILPAIFFSQILGNLSIQYYLKFIGFEGRGRLRFVFNDNVIQNSINFLSDNLIIVLWSGFLGTSILFLLVANTLSWTDTRSIFISILIALFFTSIALDTSRIFSLLITPTILFTLHKYKNSVNFQNKLGVIYSSSILLHFVIGVYYFYGSILNESPMSNSENFYNFISRIVNSLMSNIWS